MGDPTERGGDVTVRVSVRGSAAVRRNADADRVVSVLFGTGLEEWRRSWNATGDRRPEREVVVLGSDTPRGATTASPTRVSPGRGLTYTVLEPSVDADRLIDTVTEALAEIDSDASVVFIDDIGELTMRVGVTRAGETVRDLVCVTSEAGGSITMGYSLTPETAPVLTTVAGVSDRILGLDPETVVRVDSLRRDDPTTFGYVRRNWPEAYQGIVSCTRNYPQAKQIHASLSAPDITPRTLGATLSGLVTLGVLDTWSDTIGSTRYDLTEYDPSRMASTGVALAATAGDDVDARIE